jgi:hypothetical protein
MAQYYIVSPDAKYIWSKTSSAFSFNGAADSFLFSATVYAMQGMNGFPKHDKFPQEIIVGKVSWLGRITGQKFLLYHNSADSVRYCSDAPVDGPKLQTLRVTLSKENLAKKDFLLPSKLLHKP